MYRYDAIDRTLVDERVRQFRDQTNRFLAGELTEEQFRPLRLQNGLYIQKHAPMLRLAIPYGLLSSRQVRALARIARVYDHGYGHFTTRQNIQFNWPALPRVPDILAELADVEMHAIQTSGNCIRNVTSDPFAGVAHDEIADPRPYAELIRQWSTLHPEFTYLPRKFKIAISAAHEDRAATWFHDIGIQLHRNGSHAPGAAPMALVARVIVGGGLGRTPIVGQVVKEDLPIDQLFTYLDAVLRVYNRFGRRDNLYKARIKILVKELGLATFRATVEAEWAHLRGGPATLPPEEVARVERHFVDPLYCDLPEQSAALKAQLAASRPFSRWVERCVFAHKRPGYAAVTLSLKATGSAPGDIDADRLDGVATLADRFSFGEVRVTREQNLILADVQQNDLHALWEEARAIGLATPNIGLLTDIVSCPGGDYCALANAKSIPVATAIQQRIDEVLGDLDYLFDIGDISLNISGCMNACGHHHIGNIGVLGVDKHGEEFYQVTIGGSAGDRGHPPTLGKVIGPAFAREDMPGVIERLIAVYVRLRHEEEAFVEAVARVGIEPFKDGVYASRAMRSAERAEEACHV